MKTQTIILIGGAALAAYLISKRGAFTNAPGGGSVAANSPAASGRSSSVYVKIWNGEPVAILREGALEVGLRDAAKPGAQFQVVPALITW